MLQVSVWCSDTAMVGTLSRMSRDVPRVDTIDVGELKPKPRTFQWILYAVIAWCALTIISALALFGQRPFVRKALVKSNNAIKDVSKRKDYGNSNTLDKAVSHALTAAFIQALLVVVILALLTVMLLRARRWARWVLLGMTSIIPVILPMGVGILAQLVLGLAGDAPAIYKIPTVLAGLSSLAVAVFLLLPETAKYYAQGKLATVEGARPVGFGALFGPRRGAATRPARTGKPARAGRTIDVEPSASPVVNDDAAVSRPNRRPAATRPGSVKPKGTVGRGGRSKSRS
jgi:hypothetical protein